MKKTKKIAKDKECKTYEEFVEFTGMITDSVVVETLTGIETDTDNGGIMACHSSAKKLNKFLAKHKDFHAITVCDVQGGVEFDNCARVVDRQTYHLGTGSTAPAYFTDLFYEESCEEEITESVADALDYLSDRKYGVTKKRLVNMVRSRLEDEDNERISDITDKKLSEIITEVMDAECDDNYDDGEIL